MFQIKKKAGRQRQNNFLSTDPLPRCAQGWGSFKAGARNSVWIAHAHGKDPTTRVAPATFQNVFSLQNWTLESRAPAREVEGQTEKVALELPVGQERRQVGLSFPNSAALSFLESPIAGHVGGFQVLMIIA